MATNILIFLRLAEKLFVAGTFVMIEDGQNSIEEGEKVFSKNS